MSNVYVVIKDNYDSFGGLAERDILDVYVDEQDAKAECAFKNQNLDKEVEYYFYEKKDMY